MALSAVEVVTVAWSSGGAEVGRLALVVPVSTVCSGTLGALTVRTRLGCSWRQRSDAVRVRVRAGRGASGRSGLSALCPRKTAPKLAFLTGCWITGNPSSEAESSPQQTGKLVKLGVKPLRGGEAVGEPLVVVREFQVKRRAVRGKLRIALLALHGDRLGLLGVHGAATVHPAGTSRQCPKRLVYSRVPMADNDNAPWLRHDTPDPVKERVRAELDRTAVSFRRAGAANYISATFRSDGVKLNGPPREHPRRSWLGPEWQLLELLAALPDDAGVEAVWRALS
jgi:hypothetical protein